MVVFSLGFVVVDVVFSVSLNRALSTGVRTGSHKLSVPAHNGSLRPELVGILYDSGMMIVAGARSKLFYKCHVLVQKIVQNRRSSWLRGGVATDG